MADFKESFEILEDSSGNGVALSASETGLLASTKIGLTSFGYKDGSGNLILPTVVLAPPLVVDPGIIVRPIAQEYPSFTVVSALTTVGNNKSMLAIQNTGTSVVRVREIWVVNDRTAAVTGVAGIFELRRIVSFSGGTALTPVAHDTADTLPVDVTCATGATVATETSLYQTTKWSTDEWGTGATDVESFDHAFQSTKPFWAPPAQTKALTIRQNQGLHVKFATNSTAGEFTLWFIFTTGVA